MTIGRGEMLEGGVWLGEALLVAWEAVVNGYWTTAALSLWLLVTV